MSRILVVAAHADDEALGCGGTIARHAAAGDEVHILFLADGVTARDAVYDPAARALEMAEREAAAREAARLLGARTPRFCRFPDNRCDTLPLMQLVKAIEAVIAELQPTIIYTHHANDLNLDHRLTHQATLTACRPLPGSSVRAIYSFETASSTEWEPAGLGSPFQPTRYVDISGHLDAKRAAIEAYQVEMRPFPHPRSAKALEAQWLLRGAQTGLMAAEAFVVVRELV